MSDPYLNLVRDWAAVCDAAGVEGDSSVDEIVAAFRAATSPAPTREALLKAMMTAWPSHIEGTSSLPPSDTDRTWDVLDPQVPSAHLADAILSALGTPPPAPTEVVRCASCQQPVVWSASDPVAHIGCLMSDDFADDERLTGALISDRLVAALPKLLHDHGYSRDDRTWYDDNHEAEHPDQPPRRIRSLAAAIRALLVIGPLSETPAPTSTREETP